MRPIWFDHGTDVESVVEALDEAASNTVIDVRPAAQVPSGVSLSVLHQAALARVRRQLASSHGEADRTLAQEVRAVDDLVRAANLLVERLREWYALHAPEAVRLQPDGEKLTRAVADHGDRTSVLTALDHADQAATSIGNDLDAADLAVLQSYAAALRALYDSWHQLEKRVEELMQEVAPNLAAVVGPVIGARLIALAGGLQRLAGFPSGTIQLLGAETALFRHLKEGTKPPKHGIIFQHLALHSAPPWQRGALARAYAHAATMAVRADAFTQRDIRDYVLPRLEKDVARIKEQRAKPPARPAPGRGPARGPVRGPARGPSHGAGRGAPRGQYQGGRSQGPRDGGRGPARSGPPGGSRGPRGPPRDRDDRVPSRGGFGDRSGGSGGAPRRAPSGDSRGGPGGPGGPGASGARDDRGPGKSFYSKGPSGQPGKNKQGGKPRRLPGALRGDNKPAKPPGKGKEDS